MNRMLRKGLADQSSQVPVVPLPPGSAMPYTLRGGLLWCAAGVVLALALLAPWLLVGQAQAEAPAENHETATPGPWNGLSDLAFVSPIEGWAVGYAEPCTTSQADSCVPLLWHDLQGKWTTVALPFSGWLNTISMLSPRDGWIGGARSLLHYDGHTWQQAANPLQLSFLHLQMFSDTEGWAVGGNDQSGTAIWHDEGGAWTQAGPRTLTFQGISYQVLVQTLTMLSPTEGWAAGMLIQQTSSGALPSVSHAAGGTVLLHATAGHWSLATRIPGVTVSAISMASATEGWAMGNTEGTRPATPTPAVQQTPLLLHYRQGQWKHVANPVPNPQVCCLSTVTMRSASDGWAAGPESGMEPLPIATMLHYTGHQWQMVRMPLLSQAKATIARIVMTSATQGWAVGQLVRWGTPDRVTPLLLRYSQGAWSLISG